MPCQALGESAEFAGMEMEPNDGNEYLYLQIKAQVSEMFEKVYAAQNHRSSSGSGSGEDMMLLTPLDLATNSPSTPSHHSFPYSRSRRSSSAAVQPRKEGNKKTTSRRGAKRAGMTKEERAESHALSESVRRDETTLGNEYGFITVEEWFKKLVRGSGWDVYNSTNHSNQRSKNSQLYELVAWLHYLIHERKFPRRSGQVLENKRLALIIIDMFGRRAALVTEMTEVRRETELKERKAKEMGQAAATPADSPRKSSKPKKQAGSRQSHKGSVPREKL
ncbi:hypothetical protein MMC10_001224 [Thelotrema lepadinum]|nr:hypothetical protein [Thelotrema lepadinum]